MKGRERKKIKEKILFDILRNHALLQKYAGKVMGEKVIKKKNIEAIVISLISEGLIHLPL